MSIQANKRTSNFDFPFDDIVRSNCDRKGERRFGNGTLYTSLFLSTTLF